MVLRLSPIAWMWTGNWTLLNKTLIQTRRIKTNPRPLDEDWLSLLEKGI